MGRVNWAIVWASDHIWAVAVYNIQCSMFNVQMVIVCPSIIAWACGHIWAVGDHMVNVKG